MVLRVRGIQHLNLTVRDVERARAFYQNVLGFEPVLTREDTVWLEAGGDLLGLSRGEPHTQEHGHFGFRAETRQEVDVWAERLRAARVTIEKGPYERSDGRSIYFRDPEGYLLEIFFFDSKTSTSTSQN